MPLPSSPADLVRAYAQSTKKRFGQHFLTDPVLLGRIADVAAVTDGDRVLEIGPGCGTLTSTLLARGAAVTAVELDRDAAAFLREQFADIERFTLVEGDALQVDFDALLAGAGWKSVSNLPYNVGTHIMFELLRYRSRFDVLALMFQKEVADRITATPGGKTYGSLTLEVQLRAEASTQMKLKPGSFSPPPNVDSAVVRLKPFAEERIADPALRKAFSDAVTAGFATRRKTVRNALKARYGRERTDAALVDANIEPRTRAERIDFEGFLRLARALSDDRDGSE